MYFSKKFFNLNLISFYFKPSSKILFINFENGIILNILPVFSIFTASEGF